MTSEDKILPKDWKWVKLENIAKKSSGGTTTSTNPKKKKKKKKQHQKIPLKGMCFFFAIKGKTN